MQYLSYLNLKYQVQFYKDYCGNNYASKILDAEQYFIVNNPLFTETGNKPPSNASFLIAEAEKENPVVGQMMKQQFDKYPQMHNYYCDNFVERLHNMSFNNLVIESKNKFKMYMQKANKKKIN